MHRTMKKELITSRVISTAMIVLAVVACFMQFIIDDSSVNIASACIALVGSLVTLAYFRYTRSLQTHPISTFAIFGFCATTQYGALLVQTVSLDSLSKNLRQPVETFAVLSLFLMVAIAAHMTYRFFSMPTQRLHSPHQINFSLRGLLERLTLYSIPTVHQLWVMGFIGIIALLNGGDDTMGEQNIGNKISHGISFIAWAPFLIPIFVAQFGRQYCNTKLHYVLLTGFAGLIAVMGIASNARFMLVSGATTVCLIILLIGMRSNKTVSIKQIFHTILFMAICAAMLVPFAQLSTAMVVIRDTHKTSSAINKIYATIDVLSKPGAIEAYRSKERYATAYSDYDEYYVENPVLARFVNTKFHDNALFFESKLTERGQDELIDTTIDLIWSILPDPALKYLGINISKKKLRFTMGDYLYYQATGGRVGGYKYGSSFAHGIGMFGMFFPLIYFGICLLTYWILELLTIKTKKGEVMVSVVGVLLVWHLFIYGITSESLNATVSFILREIPQSILIYILIYQIARITTYPLNLFNQTQSIKMNADNLK